MPRKKIPHFRFYIDDFMNGTKGMSSAEVGDYVRMLAHLYDQGGRAPYEPDKLRHPLGCSRQVDAAAKIRRLIDLGKLFVDEQGYLHNGRTDKEVSKRRHWQDAHPLTGVTTPLPPHLPPSNSAKKPMKSMGAGTLVRATPYPVSKSSLSVPSFTPKNGNGSAPAAAGSLGLEGRSPQPPTAKGRAPPPEKEWPPPSALIGKVYPNGKAAAKQNPKPGNGTQPGRHRRRPRATAKPGRAAEDKPGAQKGTEAETPHPRRS
jgi:hypothetical protein